MEQLTKSSFFNLKMYRERKLRIKKGEERIKWQLFNGQKRGNQQSGDFFLFSLSFFPFFPSFSLFLIFDFRFGTFTILYCTAKFVTFSLKEIYWQSNQVSSDFCSCVLLSIELKKKISKLNLGQFLFRCKRNYIQYIICKMPRAFRFFSLSFYCKNMLHVLRNIKSFSEFICKSSWKNQGGTNGCCFSTRMPCLPKIH